MEIFLEEKKLLHPLLILEVVTSQSHVRAASATVRVLLLTKLVQSHALMYEGLEKAG